MMDAPRMLLIGSTAKRAGRTTLACAVIARFCDTHRLVAVKVTPPGAHSNGGQASVLQDGQRRRGGCTRYCIRRETCTAGARDTQRMLAAGAFESYWLHAGDAALADGIREILDALPEDAFAVCESTRLRRVVTPGCFAMVQASGSGTEVSSQRAGSVGAIPGPKPLSTQVQHLADQVFRFDGELFSPDPEVLVIADGRWAAASEIAR